jgi:NADH-quinone oxidoreductase subunit B
MALTTTEQAIIKKAQESDALEGRHGNNVIITSVDKIFSWARQSSVWPMTFGLACCAIEMMATAAARYDIDRLAWVSCAHRRVRVIHDCRRHSDYEDGLRVKRLYDQMPEPKYGLDGLVCDLRRTVLKHGYHVPKGGSNRAGGCIRCWPPAPSRGAA